MLREVEDTKTGRFKWEQDYCPKCKERTTHWFVNDQVTKCSMCNSEKQKSTGLGLNIRDEE